MRVERQRSAVVGCWQTTGCPCGYYGDSLKQCTCSDATVSRYQKRISGPFLDRIDIQVEVPRVDYAKLVDQRLGEPSTSIRARVEAARQIQIARFAGTALVCNAEMGPGDVREHCRVEPSTQALLKVAMQQLHLSGRGFHRVLKLARTIADLAASRDIGAAHLAEACNTGREAEPDGGLIIELLTGFQVWGLKTGRSAWRTPF